MIIRVVRELEGLGVLGLSRRWIVNIKDVHDIPGNLETGEKKGKDNDEKHLPTSAHEAAAKPVEKSHERQTDAQHKQGRQHHHDYKLVSPQEFTVMFVVVGHRFRRHNHITIT